MMSCFHVFLEHLLFFLLSTTEGVLVLALGVTTQRKADVSELQTAIVQELSLNPKEDQAYKSGKYILKMQLVG